MFFAVTSFVLIIVLSIRLSFGRYLNHLPQEHRNFSSGTIKGYVKWFGRWLKSFLNLRRWDRCLDYLIAWGRENYRGWTAWVFYLLALSYAYQALSGFFFAWFIKRGLYGFPLLLHVAAGALFAICLAISLFLKARLYLPESLSSLGSSQTGGGFCCPILKKSFPRIYFQAVAFWIFVVSGFLLIVSTLGSMLPYFNFPAQILFFNLHRWAALVSVLSAILGLDSIIE
ncbi:MAG: hypothetical protein PHQ48_07825 [Acidobacteriota bacterium]|nr:hypothetical protein [Acidobacteriota bacterium]